MNIFLIGILLITQAVDLIAMSRVYSSASASAQEKACLKILEQDLMKEKKQKFINQIKQIHEINKPLKKDELSLLMQAVVTNNLEATEFLLIKGADLKKIAERNRDNDIYIGNTKGNSALAIARQPLVNIHPLIYQDEMDERRKIIEILEHQIRLRREIECEFTKRLVPKDISNIIFEYTYGDNGKTTVSKVYSICVIS